MPETILPLFDLFESLINDYKKNAMALYGCRGILVPLYMAPGSGIKKDLQPHVVYWSAGAGWIAQFFYDYWLFTGDVEFLKNRAIPFMKEAALFYEDFLIEDKNGLYTVMPSNSPENRADGTFEGAKNISVCVNATMDFAVINELLNNLCEGCKKLNIEQDGIKRWQDILSKIPNYQINEDGAMKEWLHPDFLDNYHHRHQSHIYPIFPGFEVTKENNPEIFEACRVAVEKRLIIGLKSQTGWSLAHMANIYARLGNGDRALECLDILSRSCLGDNLFTYHNDFRNMGITVKLMWGKTAPYQIDANFGWTSAINEMLVFSTPGLIKLLPAIPSKWINGSVKGALCRGGIEASVEWDYNKNVLKASFESSTEQTVTVKLPKEVAQFSGDVSVEQSEHGKEYCVITIPNNKKVELNCIFA